MMKKQSLFLLMIIALFAASCSDDDDGTTRQQISLRADGVLFSVITGDAGVTQSDAHIRDGNKFQLDATTSTQDFSINNQNVPSTGNYIMSGAGTLLNFAQWEDGSALFTSLGSPKSRLAFTISRIAGDGSDYVRYVEGTFSGVLYNTLQSDSVVITEGQITILD